MNNERRIKTSQKIAELMNKKNMSYRELSEKTNIAKSSLQRYVTNTNSKIPMENCIKIAKALDCPISQLIDLDVNIESNDFERNLPSSLKEIMIKKNISINKLATYCGVNETVVNEWLDGSKEPTINYVQSICNCLEIKKSELLGLNQESSNNSFESIDAAMQFIIKSPVVSAYGGYDLDKMTDEEIIDFANELAEMFKVLSKRHQK